MYSFRDNILSITKDYDLTVIFNFDKLIINYECVFVNNLIFKVSNKSIEIKSIDVFVQQSLNHKNKKNIIDMYNGNKRIIMDIHSNNENNHKRLKNFLTPIIDFLITESNKLKILKKKFQAESIILLKKKDIMNDIFKLFFTDYVQQKIYKFHTIKQSINHITLFDINYESCKKEKHFYIFKIKENNIECFYENEKKLMRFYNADDIFNYFESMNFN